MFYSVAILARYLVGLRYVTCNYMPNVTARHWPVVSLMALTEIPLSP